MDAMTCGRRAAVAWISTCVAVAFVACSTAAAPDGSVDARDGAGRLDAADSGDAAGGFDTGGLDAGGLDAGGLDAGGLDAGGLDAWPATPQPVLVKQLVSTPGYGHVYGGGPLGDAVWSGASWVVSGSCDQYQETGGLWVFDGAGTLLGRSNVCLDALAEGQNRDDLLLWAHMYEVGTRLQVFSPGQVVKAGAAGSGGAWPFPMMRYDVAGGALIGSRAFGLIVGVDQPSVPPGEYNRDDAPVLITPVVSGTSILAVDQRTGGVVAAAQAPSVVAATWVPVASDRSFTALTAAVGPYIIAVERSPGGALETHGVFRLDGTGLTFVGNLPLDAASQDLSASVDGQRIGLLVPGNGAARFVVYATTGGGLSENTPWQLPVGARTAADGCAAGMLGPHVLLACRDGWQLWKDGTEVALPPFPAGDGAPVVRVAFAPDGSFVLVRYDGAWLGRLYP